MQDSEERKALKAEARRQKLLSRGKERLQRILGGEATSQQCKRLHIDY